MEGSLEGLGALPFWGITLGAFVLFYFLGSVLKFPLWLRVLIALLVGGFVGYLFGDVAASVKPVGDGFVKLIRMLIIPLIFTTIVAGVISLGDPKRLGSLGVRTILLYLCTTVFAVGLGVLAGLIVKPGVNVDYAAADVSAQSDLTSRLETAAAASQSQTAADKLLDIIPANPIEAMADGNILPIIFFSILFGIGIIAAKEGEGPVGKVMESAAEAVLKITHFVMLLAPYGVYALMAWVMGTLGLGVLDNLAKLAVALYIACAVHILFVYGGLIRVVVGLPLIRFFSGILDAMSTAYSTASSSATLPVTISNVNKNLGVEKSVAGAVLPIGATVNMDGTSLYIGLVALFAAQAVGLDLGTAEYLAIGIAAVGVSIGAAGIPSASLFLAVGVLTTIGVSEADAILIIALIFPFDRLLDMMRTMTNVTGDAAVATTVAKWEGALDEEIFRRAEKE
ncbi:dicarboxylate/amino acid:cation symporter [Parvularcula marina]|uniref:Dicarboxylate/amino acid:cation symporter n=2 Tax=Parvularcula marina TaxID=2292771 RepID=A0A371RJ14_9PROT|nr:dicarboxylate/amino acid:cation symporter [Parvularcula marina]